MGGIGRWLKSLLGEIADVVMPRYCVVCGGRLSVNEHFLCLCCRMDMPLTSFVDNPKGNIMAQRFWGLAPIEKASAFFFFRPHSNMSHIIYDFKYHGNANLAVYMGRMMGGMARYREFLEGIDVIVPVPITKKRRRERGYNQSECLAIGLSIATGLPVDAESVVRTRFTSSQTRLSGAEREENVRNAFAMVGDELEGKHILIVDDVFTTGSTLLACMDALKPLKNYKVSVLTLGYAKM